MEAKFKTGDLVTIDKRKMIVTGHPVIQNLSDCVTVECLYWSKPSDSFQLLILPEALLTPFEEPQNEPRNVRSLDGIFH